MIRAAYSRLRSLLGRFGKAREGAAAVEFALILPFMLMLYAGSIELSDLINVDRRITVISSTVGDLVARKKNGIYPGRARPTTSVPPRRSSLPTRPRASSS